ncbi:putative chitinase [Ophiocordyceps camponoti-saundersi (nom. inval.)]|nr:putative chitinase [Ophiocordyceps camponoti-saundersi (nom. inval.)]
MVMALANITTAAYGALAGYWGQTSGPDLRTFCDSGINYATLGFVNMAPENDRSSSGFPGLNFASHCWAGTFPGQSGAASQLLKNCESIKRDIPYCQAKGVKVILSIGGEYRKPSSAEDSSSDYKVTSGKNGEDFADFLYGAFGPFSDHWKGPRPFDGGAEGHVAVDGFDFDIEAMLDNEPYIAMINKLRALDSKMLITGAPQCPTNPEYFQMRGMIQKAAFDALFIQFYNNPVCDAIANNTASDAFNLDDWVNLVAQTEKSKEAKLFIGLPGAPLAAGSGYVGPDEVKKLVCKYKDRKNFGGISLWDLKRAAENVGDDGKTFLRHVLDALQAGCGPDVSPAVSAVVTTVSSSSSPLVESIYSTASVMSQTTTTTTVSGTTVQTGTVTTVCPSDVAACSLQRQAVTETSPIYTSACPVSQTAQPPSSTVLSDTEETVTETSNTISTVRVVSSALDGAVTCSGTDCVEASRVSSSSSVSSSSPSSSSSLEAELSSQPTTTNNDSPYTTSLQPATTTNAPYCADKTITEVQTSTTTITEKEMTTSKVQNVALATLPSGDEAPAHSGQTLIANRTTTTTSTDGPFGPMVSAGGASRMALSLTGLVFVAGLQVLMA